MTRGTVWAIVVWRMTVKALQKTMIESLSRSMRFSKTGSVSNYYCISFFIAAFVVFIQSTICLADPAEKQGLVIAREMKSRQKGFGNYAVDMKMVLISITGKEKIRQLRVITREVDGDGDQSLAIFDTPADVKGTGFLNHTHINRDDDQWLYLPALKRVKRISPRNKTAPFMGSEFSYEDLTSYEVANYTYKYIGDEKLAGVDCFILDRFPVNEHSGYKRQRVWVEKARYLAIKIDYYNKRGKNIKTLLSGKFKNHLNRFWFSHEMKMQNHQSGKSSILYWHNYRFRQPLRAADFNPGGLKRIR